MWNGAEGCCACVSLHSSPSQAGVHSGRVETFRGGSTEKEGSFAIFSDALNHASIIDGVRLAQMTGRAQVHLYRHSDMDHLEQLLQRYKLERRVVVSDRYPFSSISIE